ncbi:MAG: heat-inducible transcriptional repressor HrcA [Dehalococcoidia bacterium]
MALSDRRARILALIVEDYVASAQPVGSQALVRKHGLNLSSATVRNEMSALEEEGYITHPHTSAGRLPSTRGYRYYVSQLMAERQLSVEEQMTILHQFHQSAREVEEWMGLAASVLSNSMHSLALATQPRLREVRLKHIQLVELTDQRALLIVVTNDASVHQQTLEFDRPVHQEQLNRVSNRVNDELAGVTAAQISAEPSDNPYDAVEAKVRRAVADLLRREESMVVEIPVIEGIRELLRQPEFEDSDRMLDTLTAIEAKQLQRALPADALHQADVVVVIGDENREGPYQDLSFVLARYGPPGGAGGMVGILGPTRLPYGDAVAHVRYVGEVLTELIQNFYGS